ncbi:DUF4147 domain-containing protein [Myxococcota bacterium]|nr:DUF4147 domain-containing protein [Myxococcota bacterium]
MTHDPSRSLLERGFEAALSAVEGGAAVRRAIERRGAEVWMAGRRVPPQATVYIAAIGKAAIPMAQAAVDQLGTRVGGGWVVAPDETRGNAPRGLKVRRAAHPVPDERSAQAGADLLDWASTLRPEDVLLVLLSGGASALTSCPLADLTVEDLAEFSRLLLACGASIDEMNGLRKHITAVSGGRLARAAAAGQIQVLAISDVPGDQFEVIGSGPCSGDSSRFADALFTLQRYGLTERVPRRVLQHLELGVSGDRAESLFPDDAVFATVFTSLVARNADARRAAQTELEGRVDQVIDLGEMLTGEARHLAPALMEHALHRAGAEGSCVAIAGGETVVTVEGAGLGGRNQELALAAALALEEEAFQSVQGFLSVGSDGRDGPTPAAGGYVDRESGARARRLGLDPAGLLTANDSNRFLAATGGEIVTGPTGTNVMDLAFLLLGPKVQF